MEVKVVCQRGNTLQVQVYNAEYRSQSSVTNLSPTYIISGAIVFQVKVISGQINNYNPKTGSSQWINNNLVWFRFFKLLQEDNLTYTIKLTSNELGIVNRQFISDDGTWYQIYDDFYKSSFELTAQLDIVPSASPFALLHEDADLADFELRGEDGSVRVHRAVLAAASPVLKRMLSGTWREATEGCVDVPGTSKVTLQNFKDYVYLHTLPDNGLEPLFLLALCYMMKDLEQNCAFKMVSSLTAANACDLLELATKYKVTWLLLAIISRFRNETLKFNELQKHLLGSK